MFNPPPHAKNNWRPLVRTPPVVREQVVQDWVARAPPAASPRIELAIPAPPASNARNRSRHPVKRPLKRPGLPANLFVGYSEAPTPVPPPPPGRLRNLQCLLTPGLPVGQRKVRGQKTLQVPHDDGEIDGRIEVSSAPGAVGGPHRPAGAPSTGPRQKPKRRQTPSHVLSACGNAAHPHPPEPSKQSLQMPPAAENMNTTPFLPILAIAGRSPRGTAVVSASTPASGLFPLLGKGPELIVLSDGRRLIKPVAVSSASVRPCNGFKDEQGKPSNKSRGGAGGGGGEGRGGAGGGGLGSACTGGGRGRRAGRSGAGAGPSKTLPAGLRCVLATQAPIQAQQAGLQPELQALDQRLQEYYSSKRLREKQGTAGPSAVQCKKEGERWMRRRRRQAPGLSQREIETVSVRSLFPVNGVMHRAPALAQRSRSRQTQFA
jgi:hypothetical protein